MRKYPSNNNHPVRVKKELVAPQAPAVISKTYAARWFAQAMKDPWYKSQMPILKKVVLSAIGLTCFGSIDRAAKLIPSIENRNLIFLKDRFIWMDPQVILKINRLTPVAFWSLFARCLSCGGNKFLPVEIDQKEKAACFLCLPPSQYPSIGAKPIKRSLIADSVKEYL